jgi:hypothetical protein
VPFGLDIALTGPQKSTPPAVCQRQGASASALAPCMELIGSLPRVLKLFHSHGFGCVSTPGAPCENGHIGLRPPRLTSGREPACPQPEPPNRVPSIMELHVFSPGTLGLAGSIRRISAQQCPVRTRLSRSQFTCRLASAITPSLSVGVVHDAIYALYPGCRCRSR